MVPRRDKADIHPWHLVFCKFVSSFFNPSISLSSPAVVITRCAYFCFPHPLSAIPSYPQSSKSSILASVSCNGWSSEHHSTPTLFCPPRRSCSRSQRLPPCSPSSPEVPTPPVNTSTIPSGVSAPLLRIPSQQEWRAKVITVIKRLSTRHSRT